MIKFPFFVYSSSGLIACMCVCANDLIYYDLWICVPTQYHTYTHKSPKIVSVQVCLPSNRFVRVHTMQSFLSNFAYILLQAEERLCVSVPSGLHLPPPEITVVTVKCIQQPPSTRQFVSCYIPTIIQPTPKIIFLCTPQVSSDSIIQPL